MKGDIKMKNKFLTAFTIATISCVPLVSLANQSNHNTDVNYNNESNESSAIENIASDAAITISIKKKYAVDDRINSFNIRVHTINGKVTVTGTVPNKEVKNLVIAIAKDTKGVSDVITNLKITDESLIRQASSDATITAKIKLTYLDESDIKVTDIGIKTIHGVVTLTGKVPDERTKNIAISIAKETKGVKEVVSKIEVDKSIISSSMGNMASDSAITSIIKLRFFEDDILSGLDLHVKTINGEVTLSGKVMDNASKERAISIANNTNSVKKVVSNIIVVKH